MYPNRVTKLFLRASIPPATVLVDENFAAYKNCEDQTRTAMENKTQKIFIDNVFSLDWEIEPYFKLASKYNYNVFVATVENYHSNKNSHGISDEKLQKMAAKYKVKLL